MNRTVLFVYAHPDDESFLGSGLALRTRAEGGKAVLVTATLGQRGSPGNPPLCTPEELPRVREAELRAAAAIIGFDDLHLLNYQDKQLAETDPAVMRRTLVGFIRRYRPSVVVSFDPNGVNLHVDHVAIARFTMDAVSAAADARIEPSAGEPHDVTRVLWTPLLTPWESAAASDLAAEGATDFVIDVSRWKDARAAALRAHRTQHQSIDRYFFNRPDLDRILGVEIYRQAWGPPLRRRPAPNVWD